MYCGRAPILFFSTTRVQIVCSSCVNKCVRLSMASTLVTCLFCENSLNEGGETVKLTEKGLAGIIRASKVRKDGIDEKLSGISSQNVVVHVSCREMYTRKRDVLSVKANLTKPLLAVSTNVRLQKIAH